jgi:hypothetical protein
MAKEKTNQDYNKQKPNPNDPNQNHQIGDDDYELNKRREVTANTGNNKSENINEILDVYKGRI